MSVFKRIKDTFKETGLVNELCEHLRQIGLNASIVESGSPEDSGRFVGLALGAVKVEGRNIDFVQVERMPTQLIYEYHYVVKANVEGSEGKLKAKGEPKKKGLFSKEVVDYKWEGKDLAQLLNGDLNLKNVLLKEGLDKIEVKPDKKNQRVRITPKVKIPTTVSIGGIPVKGKLTAGRNEFPTSGDFEAYDRIAQHIRSITAS